MIGFTTWTWATLAAAFVFGMLLALTAGLKTTLAKKLGNAEDQATGILAAMHLTFVPMMLIAGMLVDAWGAGEVLILGAVLAAVGIVSLSLSQSARQCLCAVLLTGVGAGCVGNSATVLMPRSFFDNSAAASLNLGYVFVGLGALLTPVATDLLLRVVSIRRALGGVAMVCVVPAGLALAAPTQAMPSGEIREAAWSAPVVWIAGVVFMLYSPLEAWLGTFVGRYLTDLGYTPRRSALLLAGVWLTFLASRLVTALLQQQEVLSPFSDPWLIWMLALPAAIALGNLAGTHSRGNAAVALLLMGAFLGPIFPTLVGFVMTSFDPRQQGIAFGTMYALGAAGSCLMAPLLSPTRTIALRIPLYVLIGIALALIGTGLTLALTQT